MSLPLSAVNIESTESYNNLNLTRVCQQLPILVGVWKFDLKTTLTLYFQQILFLMIMSEALASIQCIKELIYVQLNYVKIKICAGDFDFFPQNGNFS